MIVTEQADTRECTTNSIMRRVAFRRGMEDYLEQHPFDYDINEDDDWYYERGRLFFDYDINGDDDWYYERGRLFSACYPHVNPLSVKAYKGTVSERYQRLYREALAKGAII